MCGRFTVAKPISDLALEHDWLEQSGFVAPRYNLTPRQSVPIVRLESGRSVVRLFRWGLIPSWAKDEKLGDQCANARAETVTLKPAFRRAFKSQRCLVPADGYYEWQTTPAGKMPHYFQPIGKDFFCMAGLWERWQRPPSDSPTLFDGLSDAPIEPDVLDTFTLLTTTANELVAQVHHRMPVILHPDHFQTWLEPHSDREALQRLLVPCPMSTMRFFPVSSRVNNARFDGPECIAPVN